MIGSHVKWKGQWNGLLGKWTDSSAYPVSPGRIPGLQLWYSASNPAYDAFTYEQALPTLFDGSGNGWNAAQATGSAQARFLTHDGRNYLRSPGIAGNYASTPDSAAVSITGDIDLRVFCALPDWSPSSDSTLIAKYTGAANLSYRLLVNNFSGGTLRFSASVDGSTAVSATSSAAPGFTDFSANWVRATWRQSDGRVQFFTSSDGAVWVQLGTDRTIAIASIFNGNAVVEIGSSTAGAAQVAAGIFYRAQIYNGINGTLVADFDPSRGNFNSATIGSSTGETWTINRTGLDPAMIVSARAFLPLTDDYYDIAAGAAGVLQNVGGGTMVCARAYNSAAVVMQGLVFSTNTATASRMGLRISAAAYEITGRRLDADTVATAAAAAQQSAYEFAVQAGRIDYAAAIATNFKNGAVAGSASAFQTAGLTSNTASARMRVFSDMSNTPIAYASGPVTDLLLYNQAVTDANILGLSTFLRSQAGL